MREDAMVRLVVMAAGEATRMGRDKLALAWRDATVLASVLDAVLEAKGRLMDRSAAVEEIWSRKGTRESGRYAPEGGRQAGSFAALLPVVDVEIVVVARQEAGAYLGPAQIQRWESAQGIWACDPAPRPLSASIRAGLTGITCAHEGVAFLPGDQVGVTVSGLLAIVRNFVLYRPAFLVPCCQGVPVSPAVFRADFIPELAKLSGEQGGKSVLQRYRELWRVLPLEEGFSDDLDTPAAYARLRKKYQA